MNYTNTSATKRHTISPRKSSQGNEPMARHKHYSGMLSTFDLRRLVADMVD